MGGREELLQWCQRWRLQPGPALSPFAEVPTSVFGDKLREQVEERLAFYETGEVPRKNVEVMKEAVVEASAGEGGCVGRVVGRDESSEPDQPRWRPKLI